MRIINWFKNLTKTKNEQPEVTITEWVDESGFKRRKYVVDVSKQKFSSKRKSMDYLFDIFKVEK